MAKLKSFTLDGAIGYVHIYNRALTANEIASQYEADLNGTKAPLTAADAILWLDMSEHTIK